MFETLAMGTHFDFRVLIAGFFDLRSAKLLPGLKSPQCEAAAEGGSDFAIKIPHAFSGDDHSLPGQSSDRSPLEYISLVINSQSMNGQGVREPWKGGNLL